MTGFHLRLTLTRTPHRMMRGRFLITLIFLPYRLRLRLRVRRLFSFLLHKRLLALLITLLERRLSLLIKRILRLLLGRLIKIRLHRLRLKILIPRLVRRKRRTRPR